MPFLNLDATITLADNANSNLAQTLQQHIMSISPALAVNAGSIWEDIIAPNETVSIVNTLRTLTMDGTTQLRVSLPRATESTTWRLSHVAGTAPGFRTKRAIGVDATTSIRITVLSTSIARIDTDAGTALNTAAIVVGDTFLLERSTDSFTAPFAYSANTGLMCTVVGKGSGWIDVLHNNTFADESAVLGASYAEAIHVYSAGPIAVGDILELGTGYNYGNKKLVTIAVVRDDYLEFLADDMVAETVTNPTTQVYNKIVNFISVKSTGALTVTVDGNPVSLVAIDASGAYALLSMRAKAISLTNSGTTSVTASVLSCIINGSGTSGCYC